MTDPLNDPRFPDRPQHPDFWDIVDVVNQIDGRAIEGRQSLPQILGEMDIVDTDSIVYVAKMRALKAIEILALPAGLELSLASIFIDAFSAGALFERKRHFD